MVKRDMSRPPSPRSLEEFCTYLVSVLEKRTADLRLFATRDIRDFFTAQLRLRVEQCERASASATDAVSLHAARKLLTDTTETFSSSPSLEMFKRLFYLLQDVMWFACQTAEMVFKRTDIDAILVQFKQDADAFLLRAETSALLYVREKCSAETRTKVQMLVATVVDTHHMSMLTTHLTSLVTNQTGDSKVCNDLVGVLRSYFKWMVTTQHVLYMLVDMILYRLHGRGVDALNLTGNTTFGKEDQLFQQVDVDVCTMYLPGSVKRDLKLLKSSIKGVAADLRQAETIMNVAVFENLNESIWYNLNKLQDMSLAFNLHKQTLTSATTTTPKITTAARPSQTSVSYTLSVANDTTKTTDAWQLPLLETVVGTDLAKQLDLSIVQCHARMFNTFSDAVHAVSQELDLRELQSGTFNYILVSERKGSGDSIFRLGKQPPQTPTDCQMLLQTLVKQQALQKLLGRYTPQMLKVILVFFAAPATLSSATDYYVTHDDDGEEDPNDLAGSQPLFFPLVEMQRVHELHDKSELPDKLLVHSLFGSLLEVMQVMCQHGIYHGDLHAKNVVFWKDSISGQSGIQLVDLDDSCIKRAIDDQVRLNEGQWGSSGTCRPDNEFTNHLSIQSVPFEISSQPHVLASIVRRKVDPQDMYKRVLMLAHVMQCVYFSVVSPNEHDSDTTSFWTMLKSNLAKYASRRPDVALQQLQQVMSAAAQWYQTRGVACASFDDIRLDSCFDDVIVFQMASILVTKLGHMCTHNKQPYAYWTIFLTEKQRTFLYRCLHPVPGKRPTRADITNALN